MAGKRTPPDPLEGLSPDELRELATRASELAEAEQEEREVADDPEATATEEERAAAAAAEAEEELRATAERVGLTDEATAALVEAISSRTAELTREEVRTVVREVMDEYAIEPEGGGDPAEEEPPPPASLEALQEDPEGTPTPPPAPPAEEREPETPPQQTHWFHRRIGARADESPTPKEG